METIKFKEELLNQWFNKISYIDKEKREFLLEFANEYLNRNIQELYDINKAINNKLDIYKDDIVTLIYKTREESYIFEINNNSCKFEYFQAKEVVRGIIDIIEDILPLGTVVNLKKECLDKLLKGKNIEKAEIVIVNRFIFQNGVDSYFHYAGVVYPLGFINNANTIHFTSNLIEDVVHKGYSDEKEDAYIYMVKRELIIERGMKSFSFASKEEGNEYLEKVKAGV